MEQMDRGTFMKLAGAGSVAAAVPLAGIAGSQARDRLQFRAVGGLPKAPLPSYATYLVEGTINLRTGAGLVTTRVLAGHPGGTSGVGLPGLARIIRVDRTSAERDGYRLSGVVEDRSQLKHGESADVEIVVDQRKGVVHAPFSGRQLTLSI